MNLTYLARIAKLDAIELSTSGPHAARHFKLGSAAARRLMIAERLQSLCNQSSPPTL